MSQSYPIRITVSADTRDLKEVRDELGRTSKKTDELADNTERSSRRATSALALVKAELGNLTAKYQSVARLASINITAQLDSTGVLAQLNHLQSQSGRNITINVGLDTSAAQARLQQIQRLARGIDMQVRVSVDSTQALSELARLSSTSLRDVRINVAANVSAAISELRALDALTHDRDVSIRVRVESRSTAAGINTIERAIRELNATALAGVIILNNYSDALERVRRAANDAADAIRRAADEQERLRRAGGGAGGNNDAGWRRHARSVIDVANALSGLAAKLLIVKTAMAILTASIVSALPVLGQMAAAAGAAFGTALATANVAAMSKELSKLIETTGASAEGLQKWRLAARFEGVAADLNEFGDMGQVFTDLSSQMDKLGAESGKDFAQGLKLIGLSAKQIKEMKPEDALLAIGDAVAKANMSTRDKTAFLGAISDDAAKLLPLLEKNGQKIKAITDYANKVGAIQSDAQLAAAKEANTQLSYFKVGLEGVQNQLAAVGYRVINTLGPNIKKLFIDAKGPLDDWALSVDIVLTKFKHDLDSTGSWGVAFSRMFEGMYPTLYQFLSSAGKFGKGYGEAFVTPMMSALKNGYASISESLGKAGSAESLGASLGTAMLPVIAIVDTVVGAIKLLIDNWDALKAVAAVTPVGFVAANWDTVATVFESVGNGIRGVGEALGLLNPATTENASGVQIFVAALGALLVSGAATRIALGAIGATFSTLSFALAPLGAALGLVATGIKAVALAAVANPIGALIAVIVGGAALIFANWEKIGAFFDDLWGGVKESASGLIDWWNNTTPKEKVLDIKAATIDVAKEKYSQFVNWLNNTTPKQKIIDIATGSVGIAQNVVDLFIARWNESLIREWVLDVKTFALDYAEQKSNEFSAWWDGWTLKEVVADVTYDALVWAWEKGKAFGAWLERWVLPLKDVKLDFSIIEIARNAIKSFMEWVSTIEFKLPEIKLPDIAQIGANVGAKLRKVGGDIADGLAEGMNRATSHIGAANKIANDIEPAIRVPLKTNSPSKITEAIGLDTSAGLGLGIEKGAKSVKSAAEKTAKVSVDAFKSVMNGLNRRVIELTQGEEAARRFDLTQQKILGTNQNLVISTEAQIKALEDQRKKTDENKASAESAAKAYADLISGLKGQIVTLTQGDEAGRRYDLTQQKIAGSNQDVAISLQNQIKALESQKVIKEDLAKLTAESVSLDAQMTALKAGGAGAMQAEEVRQSAINDLKEKGIGIESALAQQYIAGKAAIEAKTHALATEQDIQKNLRDVEWLSKEIEATRKGAAAVADLNIEKEVSNALSEKNLTLESDQGRRVAETTRQLAAKNKQLELTQYLSEAANDSNWLRKEIDATRKGEEALREFNIQKALYAELTQRGITAGTAAAAQIEAQIRQHQQLQQELDKTQKASGAYAGVGDAIADGFMSGNWRDAGKNVLGQLKSTFVDPLKKSLSDAIAQGLQANGGLLSSLSSLMNFSGIKSALGGVGSSIGGLFSGIASSAANGFAGIGTAISGGLSGIMGSFGTLVSAIPGWGWALAGVAGLAKLFGGPSAPKINLTQGARDGQGMLTDGQQHYTKTALGTVGATDSSYKIGREKGFVPKLHEWFKWVESFDGMIAKTLPNSIASISEALKGVEMKGANLEGFTRQRLHTIFSALPEALQVAIQGGKNIMAGTTEEIAARFMYMAQVAESGLIPALEQLGLAGTQSKESMIAFAMGLADAMGGIDAAKAALDNYHQAAYTDAERLAMTQSAAKAKLDEYNKSLGFSGVKYIDNIAELRAYIDAQDKNTEAGRKAIAAALGMVDAITQFSGTAQDAAKKLADNTAAFRDAAYTDAQKQKMAQGQAKQAIDAFNASLDLTGNKTIDNIIELRRYISGLDTSTEAGRKAREAALGMTNAFVSLGGTAEQIKQKIAGLKEGIKGLVGDLYGKTTTTTTSTSTQTAAQAALDAADTTLDSLRTRYDDEKQRIADINQAAQEAYREELARYEQLKQLAVDLREYINGFKRSNALLTPVQKLQEIQSQYNTTLAKAQGGDVDAVKNIQGLADELRKSYLDVYASSKPSQEAIAKIIGDLTGLSVILESGAGSAPNQPSTIGSTALASLEQQIAAQQSTISSLQTAANNANSAANEATATADRAAMARELAGKIGELGLATDKSAWDILAKNGINIKDLAADFGINVNKLDATFIKNTADLAGRLNVNSLDLLTRLNVNFGDLAAKFGIDINKLNTGTLGKLDTLADQLKVSTVDLAAKLGINIDQLGNLMANKLASLPNIPADIKAGLAPHLQDIRNAADPATLQRELKELQVYVNSLPPGIRGQLNDQLAGILGYTGDTKTNTGDTKTETLALRSIRSSVDNTSAHTADLTAYTRDQINARGIQLALQNSRALNQNAASIGKASIPSFDVGTPNLPHDMIANIHRGEMIFTASQGADARDLVLHNQRVIPQIADYLSEIAANDTQAPVFIQPMLHYEPPYPESGESEKTQKELLAEMRELRKEVASLRAERNKASQVVIAQGDELIRQGDASLNEQQAARRDIRLNAKLKVANSG